MTLDEQALEQIEKIVQHTAKTIQHTTAPETRELIADVRAELADLRQDFKIHKDSNLKTINDAITSGIKLNVNGKIDALQNTVNRVIPVVEAYEASERAVGDAKAAGKAILWVSGFIVSVGSAYLILKQIWTR